MARRDRSAAQRPSHAWSARRLGPLFLAAAGIVLAVAQNDSAASTAGVAERRMEHRTIALWSPYLAWSLTFADAPGNPFDVDAEVAFTHDVTGAEHRTPMFYAGDGTWEFRFTGTRTGTWTWASTSEHAPLDGWWGTIEVTPNPDPNAHGFLSRVGTRFAVPIDEAGTMSARLYNVDMNPNLKDVLTVGLGRDERARIAQAALDDASDHGFDATFLLVGNHAFRLGSYGYDEHDSENPSLETFAILERLILQAHARGLGVHLWMWGDEERRWTPIGVGGIGGEADRRLQRYIAARLGPLPGWTMSYGFDLEEWVSAEEVRAWHRNLHAWSGWDPMLMARETRTTTAGRNLDLGDAKLDVASNDERPTAGFYAVARRLLDDAAVPVLFERRFGYLRDGVWDMDTTRRALWQFTLAGGAGAVWGVMSDGDPGYPQTEQLRTHRDFWRDRFTLGLAPMPTIEGITRGYGLRDPERGQAVFYAEDASTIPLDLSGLAGSSTAVAVDTAASYHEIPIGPLEPDLRRWTAPYRSDWAVWVEPD